LLTIRAEGIAAIIWLTALFAFLPAICHAMPEYATETGLTCSVCHVEGPDGGALTEQGREYAATGSVSLENGSPPSPAVWWFRGIVRFLHLLTAVVWFGAIAYIHLFTKPRSLIAGLPRAEKRLGICSILVMATTGTLLTIWRVGSLDELWTTTFGHVWLVKIAAFLTLVIVAALATTVIDRRLRAAAASAGGVGACGLTRFVYGGDLYDATDSALWKDGVHAGRHHAGTDLTDVMEEAPHGPEVLDRVKKAGPVPEGCVQELPAVARAFVVLAYVNLVLVALVLFCVSFWRWGAP
jgi:predicted heme/steroid binding protein